MKNSSRSIDGDCDVLLTYPAEPVNIFNYMIPLGLACLGAVLEKRGYRVKIIDFSRYNGDFQRDLAALRPAIVGIGGTTPTRKGSFLTAKLVKKILPDTPVFYGGNHASFTVIDTLTNIPQIDFIIKGEGEYSFSKAVDILTGRSNENLFSIPGLAYRKDNAIIQNPVIRIDNLDALPIPARHLFGETPLLSIDFFNLPADFIMTSRGCPVCCNFCSASRMFPNGVRYRNKDSIREEIEVINSIHTIRALKIFDSTFTSSKEHVENFCSVVKPYNLLWECEIRADETIDFQLLKLMKDAGCCYIDMGLETTNETLLKKIGKDISLKKVEQILDWCGKLDIKSKVFFTFGHIYQTPEDIKNDLAYMKQKKEKIDFFATTIGLRIYPGTALETIAKKNGLIPAGFSWANYKPHLTNQFLLEPGDVLILKQNKIGIPFFMLLIIRLLFQKTVLSPEYIIKIIFKQSATKLIQTFFLKIRQTTHVISRIFHPVNSHN
jgi:radical SAM superfamily enzyme YgiQ (UPF0313 family)